MARLSQFLPLMYLFLISIVAENVNQAERGTNLWSRFYTGKQAELKKREAAPGLLPLQPRELDQDYGLKEVSGVNKRQTFTGAIAVLDSSVTLLGWVSKDFNNSGLYYFTNDSTTALVVSADVNVVGGTSVATNIYTLNGDSQYTQFGAVKGLFSNDTELKPGSYNYVFLTATNPTPNNSAPTFVGNSYTRDHGDGSTQEPSESAIWILDPKSFKFSYSYLYTDSKGSVNGLSGSQIVYFSGTPNFAVTGDFAAYKSKFGGGEAYTFYLDRSVQL